MFSFVVCWIWWSRCVHKAHTHTHSHFHRRLHRHHCFGLRLFTHLYRSCHCAHRLSLCVSASDSRHCQASNKLLSVARCAALRSFMEIANRHERSSKMSIMNNLSSAHQAHHSSSVWSPVRSFPWQNPINYSPQFILMWIEPRCQAHKKWNESRTKRTTVNRERGEKKSSIKNGLTCRWFRCSI